MSAAASLPARTKDGMPSIAAMDEARMLTGAAEVERIDLDTALAWCRENGVDLATPGNKLERLKRARAERGLPEWRVVQAGGPKLAAAPSSLPPEAMVPRLKLLAASVSELLDMVTGYTGTVTTMVTPEIAGWLLELNTGNRPVIDRKVAAFAQAIREGRWQNTGHAVVVSREGILNDGQHRLLGVRRADQPVEMDVRFGIPRSAFHVTDTGTRRTAGQVVAIARHSHATAQAGIARLLYHYDAGQMAQASQRLDNDAVLLVVEAEPTIAAIAAHIQRFKFQPARTAPLGAILVVAARGAPLDRVFAFADTAAGGVVPSELDPAHQLHIRLRDAAISRQRLGQLDTMVLAVRAWNAWIEGRELSRLVVTDADRTSAGFPKVIGAPT